MKLFLLACLVAVAVARPQSLTDDEARERDRNAQILSYNNEQTPDGGNVHSFESDNGISREETIELKEVRVLNEDGQEEYRLVPFYTGSFRFPQSDGTFVERQYYSDETGIHFIADDLPQAPQVPTGV